MIARTPAVGRWLLGFAGVDDALAGDLAEAFLARPSFAWYWRQALAAVVMSWSRTLVEHRWLALRAVCTGWVVWAAFFLLITSMRHASGRSDWMPMAVTGLRYANWLVIGWAIGRSHRPYALPMVLAYVAFTILMSIPAVSRGAVDLLGHPSYAPPSAPMLVFAVISLIAGGVLSAASVRHDAYPSRAAEHPGR